VQTSLAKISLVFDHLDVSRHFPDGHPASLLLKATLSCLVLLDEHRVCDGFSHLETNGLHLTQQEDLANLLQDRLAALRHRRGVLLEHPTSRCIIA